MCLRADTAAKAALSLPVTNMKQPACELIPRVSKFCLEEWQDIWNSAANNKLYTMYHITSYIQLLARCVKITSLLVVKVLSLTG